MVFRGVINYGIEKQGRYPFQHFPASTSIAPGLKDLVYLPAFSATKSLTDLKYTSCYSPMQAFEISLGMWCVRFEMIAIRQAELSGP